ncbi:MAG: hypothetical protein IPK03_11665 [Bacteroidetes bacterium]|nr:hypothetical protein [Bacteroidota bacterium]
MEKKIIIHNRENFVEAFSKMICDNKPFAEISSNDFEISFSDVEPIEGYEIPISKETGEALPNCCDFHKNVFSIVSKWFDKFPSCCDLHRRLLKEHWFKKENYKDVSMKVVKQLSFTTYLIQTKIGEPEWYKVITDYIDYNIKVSSKLMDMAALLVWIIILTF